MKFPWLLAALMALLVVGGCSATIDQTQTASLPSATTGPLAMRVNGKSVTLPPRLTAEVSFRGTGRGGEDVREFGGTDNFFDFKQIGSNRVQVSYLSTRSTVRTIDGVRRPVRKTRKCRPHVKTFSGGFTKTGRLVVSTSQCGGARATLTPRDDDSWDLHMILYGNGTSTGTLRPA